MVKLPDFLNTYKFVLGEIIINMEDSAPQSLTECLRLNKNEKPCVCIM